MILGVIVAAFKFIIIIGFYLVELGLLLRLLEGDCSVEDESVLCGVLVAAEEAYALELERVAGLCVDEGLVDYCVYDGLAVGVDVVLPVLELVWAV